MQKGRLAGFAVFVASFCVCLGGCLSPSSRTDLVAIYALDERDKGGDLKVSLGKRDLEGQARYRQQSTTYYVSPAIAAQLIENPELFDALIAKKRE